MKNMNMKSKLTSENVVFATLALGVSLLIGCDFSGNGLVQAGDEDVANGKFASAEVKYIDAMKKKNGLAYCRYGALQAKKVLKRLEEVTGSNPDYLNGCDVFLADADNSLVEGRKYCKRADKMQYSAAIEESLKELDNADAALYEIKDKVTNAKIEKGIVLTDSAFLEIVKAMKCKADTGNYYADVEKNKEQLNRFVNKFIVVAGNVKKVEFSFLGEPKAIIECAGKTISAKFDGMKKKDAAAISVGKAITIKGQVSARPVLSDLAMANCTIIN